ncbi:MAG TPA: cysteine dioxygenase family protein [Gaiellaceae bacterium]|jgi:hypothetical protein
MTGETEAWIAARIPADRDLEQDELTSLAQALGAERGLWESHVRHDPEERVYVELYRDVRLDVWLICWLDHQDTGFHDHDQSSGAVYVCDGILAENRLTAVEGGLKEAVVERPAGTVFSFDAARVHRMHHVGGGPATSIHVYSPALWRMGHYDFDEEQNLRRVSITYADEMWTGRSGELGAGFLA